MVTERSPKSLSISTKRGVIHRGSPQAKALKNEVAGTWPATPKGKLLLSDNLKVELGNDVAVKTNGCLVVTGGAHRSHELDLALV